METLPAEVVAEVLRVLPPRSLAVARCVCKGWRDIIDAHTLLLPHLLPHSLHGIFFHYIGYYRPHLFTRLSSSSTFPVIDALLSFLPKDPENDSWEVVDICNGLVLCLTEWGLYVCNPATQRWTLLPKYTTASNDGYNTCAYISFDPIMSPHYEVFKIPEMPNEPAAPEPPPVDKEPDDEDPCLLMEWPLSPWIFKVFSSWTGLWKDRSFLREGQPAGTVQDLRLDRPNWTGQRHAVYHNGALYVHCRGSFMARFSLSSDKNQVVNMPQDDNSNAYLGKSKNQVYFGVVAGRHLRVWMLAESCGRMEWLLKYEADICLNAAHVMRQVAGSWMVEEYSDTQTQTESTEYNSDTEENIEWDSDNDGVSITEARNEYLCDQGFDILGFHPFKEVVLFMIPWFGVVSYHLNSSKMQYLGMARPKCYGYGHTDAIDVSFIYTPCMVGDLHHGDNTGQMSFED